MNRKTATIVIAFVFVLFSWLQNEGNIGSELRVKEVEVGTTTTATKTSPSEQLYLVTRVVDGDTIEVEGGEKVRYIGMDTPETVHPNKAVQCFGKEASAKNKEMVSGKIVRLVRDVSNRDRYGRLLRYVYLGDVFVNLELVQSGYARVATFPPDVAHKDDFLKAEREARAASIGLWSMCK